MQMHVRWSKKTNCFFSLMGFLRLAMQRKYFEDKYKKAQALVLCGVFDAYSELLRCSPAMQCASLTVLVSSSLVFNYVA